MKLRENLFACLLAHIKRGLALSPAVAHERNCVVKLHRLPNRVGTSSSPHATPTSVARRSTYLRCYAPMSLCTKHVMAGLRAMQPASPSLSISYSIAPVVGGL